MYIVKEGIKMSMQEEIEYAVNNLSEEKAKEILIDFVLPLSNFKRSKSGTYDVLVEVYNKHFRGLKN